MERYGADLAHPLDQLSEKLPEYLAGAEAIAFRVGRHTSVESMVLSAWGRQLDTYARTGTAALGLVAPTPILHRLRLARSPMSWSVCERPVASPQKPTSWPDRSPARA